MKDGHEMHDANCYVSVCKDWLAELEERNRDLRQILKAWALGDDDKMTVLMHYAFLREFGKAPELEKVDA